MSKECHKCLINMAPGKPSVPFFRQLWLVLGVKLMEINSNLFSRQVCPIHVPKFSKIGDLGMC